MTLKLCKFYPNPIFQAKEDLAALANSMGPSLFGDCLKPSQYRSYALTGSTLHMTEMPQYIDDYCRKPGCVVREYSQICIIQTQYLNLGAFKFFWVEADSDQIFSIVSRINKIRIFL
jgi:hypothetical protein